MQATHQTTLKILFLHFEAKIGRWTKPNNGIIHEKRNSDIIRFTNRTASQNLIAGSTIFLHKTIHKIRWISPDAKPTNQISNLIIDTSYSKNVLNVRNYRGSKVDSDMFLHTAKIVSRIYTKYFHKQNESGGPAVTVELNGMNSKRNAD